MTREVISLKFKVGKIILIFALLAAMTAAPAPGFNGHQTSDPDIKHATTLDGVSDHPPILDGINATAKINRTVGVRINSQVEVQDDITVTIKDNVTTLWQINMTIPSIFMKNVQSVKTWVQYSSFLDIQRSENQREFEMYQGAQGTTFYIDVTNDTIPITDNITSKIYVRAQFIAINSITFSLDGFEQRGEFIAPISSYISNIPSSGKTEVGLTSQHDRISGDTTGDYQINNNSAIFAEFFNGNYDRDVGMQAGKDYSNVVFKSTTNLQEGGFSVTIPFIYKNVERKVIIDPYGYVYVREHITLLHLGAPKPKDSPSYLRSFGIAGSQITVPGSATVTDVYDSEGSLNHKDRETNTGYPKVNNLPDNSFKGLSVKFRNTIYGGEEYSFYVEYRFSTTSTVFITSGDNMMLNATLFSHFNGTVSNFNVNFEFPEGATFVGTNFEQKNRLTEYTFSSGTARHAFSIFRHPEFTVSAVNFTEFDNNDFNIFFTYNRAWVLTPILSYTVATIIVIFAYAGFAIKYGGRSSKKVDIIKEKIPLKELEDFHRVFTDYQSASSTLEKLKQDRRAKKINKREFDEQTKSVNKRLKNLNIELEKVVANAKDIPHKYFSLIQNTMNTFNKLQNTFGSLRENRKNYREKKITKGVYQNMVEEYNNTISDLQAKVDRNLTSIEELIF